MPKLVEYADAPPEVRAVFDDIKRARGVPDVNNFWKALAVHPPTLRRTWDSLEEVMAPGGALDPLTKEMLYLAVSAAAGCAYCVASHTAAARAKGMTEAMHGELLAVIAMAAETNRLAEALRVPVDPAFDHRGGAAGGGPVPGTRPAPGALGKPERRPTEAAMATQTDGGDGADSAPQGAAVRNPGDQAAPGAPQTGETTCPECGGSGRVQGGDCPNCGGTGQVVQIVGDA